MTQFVKVGSRAEFEDLEGGKVIEADGQCIAVFNIGGSYYAIENTCPHRGGPLAEGMVTGEEVICPWHGSRFNVKTGSVVTPPARQGVKSFPVRVTGNEFEIASATFRPLWRPSTRSTSSRRCDRAYVRLRPWFEQNAQSFQVSLHGCNSVIP
jgi:3-phenylpropionate/trans-cinnamate dioxygenase ferredoxin component